ncbi:MAG: polysaccharide deacetylase family protein [Bacteroidota bacterium]|nr:polysaccharide deacetylase family protein [Bacteroidota bacterium]
MLLIFLPKTSSRIEYIAELLFKQELGIDYQFTFEPEIFKNYRQEKMNYSSSSLEDEFFIKASPLLYENFIEKKEIVVEEKRGTKVFFTNDESCHLGFDIFSAIFYMVSRYEEYLPFIPDQYGRFSASNSLAFQNNFLQIPIVNNWIAVFKNILQKKYPDLKMISSNFNAILTYDIDIAYQFKGRSFTRNLGSTILDLLKFRFKNIYNRAKTFLNLQNDPWDVYDYLSETITENNLQSIFFFLLADKSTYDRNLNYRQPLMKKLISSIKTFSEIGIHPSFASSALPEKIKIEKERLEKISGKEITKSRQHFLKFNLPDTYNNLLAAGITEDYSMAFPDKNGFRAGTCKPFYFYDLKNEKATHLKIFPVTLMDATFIYYTANTPEKSLIEILNLLKEVKKVSGAFISIWHNNHLGNIGENKNWRSVHNRMVMQLKSYLKSK